MMALTAASTGATSSLSGSSQRKSMFASLFSKTTPARDGRTKRPTTPGLGEGEVDCLHDERLESVDLTAIWRASSSKLDANEKALLEALHTAYLSRTEALRTYQATVLSLTDQLTDLKTSNSALKTQLDITSQAHASLLSEITHPHGPHSLSPHAMSSDDGRLSPQSEGDDSGWWSDSGLGVEEEEDRMTMRSVSPGRGAGLMRGTGAQWGRGGSPETGEVKLLRKENSRLREEVERLEGVLEDCSIVLGGMEAMRR